jgi:hypothetical protein
MRDIGLVVFLAFAALVFWPEQAGALVGRFVAAFNAAVSP